MAAAADSDARIAAQIARMTVEEKVAHLRTDLLDRDAATLPFPLPLALAATWDPVLVQKVHAATATLLRSRGVLATTVSLDVSRDPRRGRIAHTFGEDPYLVSELAVAAIEGLRGTENAARLAPDKVLVAGGHWAGPALAAADTDSVAPPVSPRELRDIFFPPFEQAVRRTRMDAIVAARNDIDGIPSHANRPLLNDVLRGEWGFSGAVIGAGVEELHTVHAVVGGRDGAARLALEAGIDGESGSAYATLAAAVKAGAVPIARIDEAAARMVGLKDRAGPRDPPARPLPAPDANATRALALQAAQRAIVLLKNEGVLPLDRRVAPAIGVVDLGGGAAIADALRATGYATVIASTDAAALARVAGPLVVILAHATLDGARQAAFDAIAALGRPIVTVLAGERPAVPVDVSARSAALVAGWGLGSEASAALTGVLFGDVNPGGKLAVTLARGAGHLPTYYNVKPSARRGYLFESNEPLYPFGFGLGYAPLELGPPRLSTATIGPDGSVRVSVDVANTGTRAGDETVQLYVRDKVSSVTRPVKVLRGFQRVTLAPGERRTLTFTLEAASLALWDAQMRRTVEPGAFDVMTGPDSRRLQSATLTVVAGGRP